MSSNTNAFFVKIDFDNNNNNNNNNGNYTYEDFAVDLHNMPCSRVFFMIHKNTSQNITSQDIVCCGIAKKENIYPVDSLENCLSTFNGIDMFDDEINSMEKYIPLPLSIIRTLDNIEDDINKFSVVFLLFDRNCQFKRYIKKQIDLIHCKYDPLAEHYEIKKISICNMTYREIYIN